MNPAEPTLEQPPRIRTISVQPEFWRALRGLWLLNWKRALSVRRLPALLAALIAIPCLTYYTIGPAHSWTLSGDDLVGVPSLVTKLRSGDRPIDQYVADQLSASTKRALENTRGRGQRRRALRPGLVQDLNTIIQGSSIYETGRFEGVALRTDTKQLLAQNARNNDPQHLNRLLIEDAYPQEISRNVRSEATTYFEWTVDFYLLVLIPLYCLFTCGAIVRDEVQGDTLGFLITRPISRARLLAIQYLCQVARLQLMVFVNGLLLFAVGVFKDIPDVRTAGWLLLGAQVLAVFAYGALSTLLGLIHTRYLVLGIIYGFVVEVGIGKIPTNINTLSLSHHLQTIMANVNKIEELYNWSPQGTAFSIFVMVLATLIFLGVAAVVFTFREYHHSEEMQK